MTAYGWLWLGWFVAALALEGAALLAKDRPGKPRTLSANLVWLAKSAGWWHVGVRIMLTGFLVWLPVHLGLLD